jgi:hypothetical protein
MEQRHTEKVNGAAKTGRAAGTDDGQGEETQKPGPEQTVPQCGGSGGCTQGGRDGAKQWQTAAEQRRGKREDGGGCGEWIPEGTTTRV